MKRRLIVLSSHGAAGTPAAAGGKADSGSEFTARLAQATLIDTITLAQTLDFGRSMEPPELVFAYRGDRMAYQRLLSNFWLVVPQMGSDLAQHLDNLLIVLGVAPDDQTVFIGTETPHLPIRALQNAYISLGQHNIVLGPAESGGTHLLGVTGRWPCGILAQVRWHDRAAEQDLRKAFGRAHMSVSLLEPFYALRDRADLQRLEEDLGIYPDRCLSRVRTVIEALGAGRESA